MPEIAKYDSTLSSAAGSMALFKQEENIVKSMSVSWMVPQGKKCFPCTTTQRECCLHFAYTYSCFFGGCKKGRRSQFPCQISENVSYFYAVLELNAEKNQYLMAIKINLAVTCKIESFSTYNSSLQSVVKSSFKLIIFVSISGKHRTESSNWGWIWSNSLEKSPLTLINVPLDHQCWIRWT